MQEWDRRVVKLASWGITTVVIRIVAKGRAGMEVWVSSDDSIDLRYGDGVADATEGVVAAVAAVGGDELTGLTANWRQYCTEQAAIQRQTAA